MKNTKLFNNLMKLCAQSNDFYFINEVTPFGTQCRTFYYRNSPSYNEWNTKPDALECHGIMFEVENNKPVRVISRPAKKIFDAYLYDISNIPKENIESFTLKYDGIKISSFYDGGYMHLKTCFSINHQYAIDAYNLLMSDKYKPLYDMVTEYAKNNFTVDLEFMGAEQRIVEYPNKFFMVTGIRNNDTGEEIDNNDIQESLEIFYGIPDIDVDNIEGYVVKFKDGLKIKLKTKWFIEKYDMKKSVTDDQSLVIACLDERTDVLLKEFASDPVYVERIKKFNMIVLNTMHWYVCTIKNNYDRLKGLGLDRQKYSERAQIDLPDIRMYNTMMMFYDRYDSQACVSQAKIFVGQNWKELTQ